MVYASIAEGSIVLVVLASLVLSHVCYWRLSGRLRRPPAGELPLFLFLIIMFVWGLLIFIISTGLRAWFL